MSTEVPTEVRLGNDVARAFRHLPHEEATAATATHLARFWDPRMRRGLVRLVRAGHPGLDPLLAAAAAQLADAGDGPPDRTRLRS